MNLRTLEGTICVGTSHQEQCLGSFDKELVEPPRSSSFDIASAVVGDCAKGQLTEGWLRICRSVGPLGGLRRF